MKGDDLMISAIQNSPVNSPKPQNKVAFGTSVIIGPCNKKILVPNKKTIHPKKVTVPKNTFNIPNGLPMTFEGFVNMLAGIKKI